MEKENKFTPRPADLNAFAADIRRRNAEKGFWPESGRNLSECFMLIVEEIGESITAHRKNRFANLGDTVNWEWLDGCLSASVNEPESWITWFEKKIKGTVDEELADIEIRLLDITGAPCEFLSIDGYLEHLMQDRESFCQKISAVASVITSASEQNIFTTINFEWAPGRRQLGVQLSGAIYATEHIAHSMNIDLWAIVQLKLAYNATRPFMHGKNY